MTTKAQIEDYLTRSGDKKLPDGNLEENEHGFCIWRITDNALILAAVYGDGAYWNEFATQKAKECNMKQVIFSTKRKPEAFMRKHGYTVTGYILARNI